MKEVDVASSTSRERQPLYLREMMERLGIEPGGGVMPRLTLSYATALHRCEACRSTQACRDWLDNPLVSAAFAPRFCPNTDILFQLRADQPGPAMGRASSKNRGRPSSPPAGIAALAPHGFTA
jgi:hypothetical protein